MINKISPCLWFDGKSKEAADFYCTVFGNSKIVFESPMVVNFEIEGFPITALNGGPAFSINPSISLFVYCTTDEEIHSLWDKLLQGGTAMMNLNEYPWSKKYGWVSDKFGMTWQLMLTDLPEGAPKITPSLLFVGKQYGKAQEAIKSYTGIFTDSSIQQLHLYLKEEDARQEGKLKFGQFKIADTIFAAMDGFGEHNFEFNEAVSFVVQCDTQEEIDYHWNLLTKDGQESMCGWLKDKFGVSWQIIPKNIGKLLSDKDKAPAAMKALMAMKKIDLAALENA